jgi:hypothetical protein
METTKPTIEDLLKPRYRVSRPYPEMERHNIKVGDILTDPGGNQAVRNQTGDAIVPFEWETFPNIFEPLPWWQERDDLPDFLKHKNKNRVVRVYGYRLFGDCFMPEDDLVFPESLSNWLPATEAEYIEYITSHP